MMINRISGITPHAMNDCCKPHPQAKNVPTDTITFTATPDKFTKLANDIFVDLSKKRKGSQLGEILGKKGSTNFRLKETEFGKKAELDVIRGDEFATFEISRNPNSAAKIAELDNGNSRNLVQLVQRFVKGLK